MAEIVSWLKLIGYVSVPIGLFFGVFWGVKNYKKKENRLKINQHSAKVTNMKQTPFSSEREETSDVVGDNIPGGLNGQMELERRRFAGEKL